MKRVFISSVISGFEEYRKAAKRAVELMSDRPIMSEDFGARPYSSEKACFSEVEASDVYIVILGKEYGFETEENISVTQAEFTAAKQTNKPTLVFIQDVEMEERQQKFKAVVEEYKSGLFRAIFSTPEELKDEIIRALKQLDISRDVPAKEEFQKRLKTAYDKTEAVIHHGEPEITITFWPQPLRPLDLNKVESELDTSFAKLCGVGLATLKDGYAEVQKKNHVGLMSERTRYLVFEDGLTLIGLDLTVKRAGALFDSSFVSPSRLKELCEGVGQIVDVNGAWCGIKLDGMDGKSVEEPPPIGTSSIGYRMFGDSEAEFQKLFIPLTSGSLHEWFQYCVGRFERIFSK